MSAAMAWPRKVLFGPSGVRAGFRLLLFAALVFGLNQAALPLQRALVGGGGKAAWILCGKARLLAALLAGTLVMGRLEGRHLADYGLPWRRMLRRELWQGAAFGFAALTVLVALLWLAGALRFEGLGLHGAAIPAFALAWTLAFLLVGVEEEFYYRGYGLFTLADGIGFWPAAVLLSAGFGYSHLGITNETWLGAFNAGVGGLVFCLFLRRTGDLRFPIGFHTGWNWAQTYVYGVAVSGHAAMGNLLGSTVSGPPLISGGSVGPEGSVLCLAVLIVVALAFTARWKIAVFPRCTPSGSIPSG